MEEEAQNEPCRPLDKIRPLQLREQYHLQTIELACQAQVEPRTVYFLWLGYPIARQEAEQILAAISTRAGQSYTLDNVRVVLVPEDEGQAEPSTPGI